jgi:hypothetical protein
MVPMVPEWAREIEHMRQEAGLSVSELLEALREQQEQSHVEHDVDRAEPSATTD